MKKIEKGTYGYLKYRKKIALLIMVASYAVIAGLFLIGFIATKSTANIMTVVAVVGALPAAKFTVDFVVLVPHHSASAELVQKTENAFGGLEVYYDLVFSNSTSPIGTQAVVVADTLAIALTDEEKADARLFEKSVEEFSEKSGHPLNIKLYTDESSFIAKAKVMSGGKDMDAKPSMRIERNAEALLKMCL
jgi:hypothetical protein